MKRSNVLKVLKDMRNIEMQLKVEGDEVEKDRMNAALISMNQTIQGVKEVGALGGVDLTPEQSQLEKLASINAYKVSQEELKQAIDTLEKAKADGALPQKINLQLDMLREIYAGRFSGVEPEEKPASQWPDNVRKAMLNYIFANTHKGYKGGKGEERSILIMREGTSVVPLSSLTDKEIKKELGPETLMIFEHAIAKGSSLLAKDIKAMKATLEAVRYPHTSGKEALNNGIVLAKEILTSRKDEALARNLKLAEKVLVELEGKSAMDDKLTQARVALTEIAKFIPMVQRKIILDGFKGEESDFFADKVLELKGVIDDMPQSYETDGQGDKAIAHLHYFSSSADWFITEKDQQGGVNQAFGLADLGYGGEVGYISIAELTNISRVELDLHWTPKTLGSIRGTDDDEEDGDLAEIYTELEALAEKYGIGYNEGGKNGDVFFAWDDGFGNEVDFSSGDIEAMVNVESATFTSDVSGKNHQTYSAATIDGVETALREAILKTAPYSPLAEKIKKEDGIEEVDESAGAESSSAQDYVNTLSTAAKDAVLSKLTSEIRLLGGWTTREKAIQELVNEGATLTAPDGNKYNRTLKAGPKVLSPADLTPHGIGYAQWLIEKRLMSEEATPEQEYDLLPDEVKSLIAKYDDRFENEDKYQVAREMLAEAEAIGWTFDYGLDGVPFDWERVEVNEPVETDPEEADRMPLRERATKILDGLINGQVTDYEEFDRVLGEIEEELEGAGLVEEFDDLLNAATDKLSEILEAESGAL